MTFDGCPRYWYYKYILKIPAISDMCYAYAGSAIHNTLEQWYSGNITEMDKAKQHFLKQWKINDLDNTKIKNKKDSYWLMILNGINLKIHLTSTEMKIFYPDVVGYLDGVDTENDRILDWKSSTRSKINEEEYTMQLKFYSYLYKRKFNRLPKKVAVYYLKYNGSKGILEFEPTEEHYKESEEWHTNIQKRMLEVKAKKQVPAIGEHCNPWCPFENVCQSEQRGILNFDLYLMGNYVHINGPIPALLNKGIEKKFSYELKNAHWIKQARPNANTTISFWNLRDRKLPIGFLQGLKKTLKDYAQYKKVPINIIIHDKRNFVKEEVEMPDKFINDIVLRDYQDEAVNEFLKNKIGILEIGTGGGKTEIAIEIIRRLKMRTLFIVDKIELLRQTKERMEKALGIEVGQLGQGVEDIHQVTVATVQTITRNIGKYAAYLRTVRLCIFDETHKVAARSYFNISQQLINTEYRLGISGTAYRDDGNDMMINASAGYKVFDLSSKKLIEKGWLVKPQVFFIKEYMSKEEIKATENSLSTGLINETPNYANFYKGFISGNARRNLIIRNLITENSNKRVLILTKLIEHGQDLQQLIPGSEHLYGATNKKERKAMFDKFVSGEIKVLISTLSIFAEGIDIPELEDVINAGANKGDVKTIQILGRILRKLGDNKNATYYDFIDETKFFRLASLARKRALIREGHDVEVIKYDNS